MTALPKDSSFDMSGLFEFLAADENANRAEQRKALALARARASRRFANFIDNGERDERLALVAGEVEETVKQACAEVGYDNWEPIYEAVTASLGMHVESVRKPKMCPYHREVTDISLAAGDPAAGFGAMAQHAWSPNHCQGEWEGRCNFKPEMATQTYWDQKAEKAEERRQERQQQMEQAQELEDAPLPIEDEVAAPVDTSFPPSEPDFADTPETDTYNFQDVGSPATPERVPAMASTRQAEALKTVDVTSGGDGASPVMDKNTWTPTNITWDKDAEMNGTPHPTHHQDIIEPVSYSDAEDDGRFDQTRTVTETQDVTQEGGIGRATGQGGTFPSGNQATPVTSAQDPDKNPLLDDDEEEEEQDA
jgi:hypothetical protein